MKKLLVITAIIASSLSIYANDEDAKIYFKGKTVKLKDGMNVYDRPYGGQIGEAPEKFKDTQISILEMEENPSGKGFIPVYEAITFKVKKEGAVYIIVDAEDSKALLKDGWTQADQGTWGYNGKYRNVFLILSKTLKKGEYTLPITKGFGTRIIDM